MTEAEHISATYSALKQTHDALVAAHQAVKNENAALSRECALMREYMNGNPDEAVRAAQAERDLHKQDAAEVRGELKKHARILTEARRLSGSTSLETIDVIIRDMRLELTALKVVRKAAEDLLAQLPSTPAAESLRKACAAASELSAVSAA